MTEPVPAAGPSTAAPVAERVMVRFRGEGSGVEDLSWGQLELWTAMRRQEQWLPIGAALALPPGSTVGDAAAELRFLMSRYQTARTRLRFDAGRVRQVVAAAGEIRLEVVDAAPGSDPAVVAEQVRARYARADYDFVHEWPVRAAVVRHGGAATHLVIVMCHLVTDAAGAGQLAAELRQWRRSRPADGGHPAPPAPMQPMEQARWQRSPAGRRVDDAAARHWEKLLRTVPARRFPGSRDPRRPRHWSGEFHSPAMWLAVRAVAGRLRVATASVLLTAYAVGLARVTGSSPVVVQVVSNNRFRAGLAGTVGPASQTGLCALDVAGTTMAEAVARVRRQAMAAYKYAYYDPLRMEELVARVGRERGEEIDIGCYFNDRRRAAPDQGAVPEPERLARAARGTFRWRLRQDQTFERLFVHLEEVPDEIGITVSGDTHCLAPADMEALVHGMEQVAVAAAADPAVPTGVPPFRTGAG